jgi:hypothetical protein
VTATLIQKAALAVDPGFQARVQMAMVDYAAVVLGTAIGSSQDLVTWNMRAALAVQVLADGGASQLTAFAFSVAGVSGVAADLGTAVTIASTQPGPPASVTTVAAHGMSTGNTAEIVSAQDSAVNGTWTVTVTSTTAFTIPVAGFASEGPGGFVTPQPTDSDIISAVGLVWGPIAGLNVSS